ncbi:MAG: hypothetical protein HY791_03625 [Deltaproteobacteria bacterium]|nr:hypothetical protein [Deltaproteobacteria bacterium]
MRLILAFPLLAISCAGDPTEPWRPESPHVDRPYRQEVSSLLGAAGSIESIRSLCLTPAGEIEAATEAGLMRYFGEEWTAADTSTPTLASAFDATGRHAVLAAGSLRVDDQLVALPAGTEPSRLKPRSAGGFWVLGSGFAASWDTDWTPVWEGDEPVVDLVETASGWALATPSKLVESDGTETSSSALLRAELRALAIAPDATLWVGTANGLVRRKNAEWVPFTGKDGLHFGDIVSLIFDEADLWVATTKGASVYRDDGTRRYYLGRLWLPSDEVHAILPMSNESVGSVIFGTTAGVSRVEAISMTLERRAEIYDQLTQERHVRLGFTSTENHLLAPGDVGRSFSSDDDNDGQWTGMYLASQSYRFAVTRSEAARSAAKTAADALLRLHAITEKPGFFARSIVTREECGDPLARAGEWHVSADGQWCWKGNTSSDELVGHVFGLSLYYDLVADEAEREVVRSSFAGAVSGLIDAGFGLRDLDGEITQDGHFDPAWMHDSIVAQYGDAGLNSAMILGALSAAFHMTSDPKFQNAFQNLAFTEGYADYVSRIEDINLSFQTNHDSEEMSFLALFTLMRYETNQELASLWRKGIDGLWSVQRPERNPEFNFMFGALTKAEDPDLAASVETLQKLPLELVLWGMDLSHRADRDLDGDRDRFGRRQNEFVFPYDERRAMRWSENPYAYELAGSGQAEASGTFWLLPYWMARYYGYLVPLSE